MDEKKKQEPSFELRSEKVRSIVGQIPPSLLRYGITVIGSVLASLLIIAFFMPYKKVYSGTASIYAAELPKDKTASDSVTLELYLKFDQDRPFFSSRQEIVFQSPKGIAKGSIISLSSIRDTQDRQKAVCRFEYADVRQMSNQNVDFKMTYYAGNLLRKMLGDL